MVDYEQIQVAKMSYLGSKEGQILALGGSDGLVRLWNTKEMKLEIERTLYQKEGKFLSSNASITAIDFSRDDKLIILGDKNGCIKVMKVSDGKVLREMQVEGDQVLRSINDLRINSRNAKVYVMSLDNKLRVFGLKSG